MLRDNLRDNHVKVVGRLSVSPEYICEYKGKEYYDGLVLAYRRSDAFDEIPITTDGKMARAIQVGAQNHPNADIVIEGKIVTRGSNLRAQTLLEYPMAIEVEEFCFNTSSTGAKPVNEVEIKGYVCENPVCRVTPSGLKICELTIAVPKKSGGNSAQNYIKCITWNGTARFASRLYIGAFVEGMGRFQSREYRKVLANGSEVRRTAYEVSLYVMADGRV